MQEGVACFERTCCVQGRFQVGLNYWRERESFEKKGANGFKQSVKICQINEICWSREGSDFFFLCGLSNSKTADTYWRILVGELPAVWLVWHQSLSPLNCTAYSLLCRIQLRAGLELPSGILVSLERWENVELYLVLGLFFYYEPYWHLGIWMSPVSCKRTCFIFRIPFAMSLDFDTTEDPEIWLLWSPRWEAWLENALTHVSPICPDFLLWKSGCWCKMSRNVCVSGSSRQRSQSVSRTYSNPRDEMHFQHCYPIFDLLNHIVWSWLLPDMTGWRSVNALGVLLYLMSQHAFP